MVRSVRSSKHSNGGGGLYCTISGNESSPEGYFTSHLYHQFNVFSAMICFRYYLYILPVNMVESQSTGEDVIRCVNIHVPNITKTCH